MKAATGVIDATFGVDSGSLTVEGDVTVANLVVNGDLTMTGVEATATVAARDYNVNVTNLNTESPLPKNVAQHQPELASFPSGSNG